jgi:hypothetical protein
MIAHDAESAFVAAPRKRVMPEPPYLEPKDSQRVVVLGHSVLPDVSTHHRLQLLAYFGNGFVHPSLAILQQANLQPFLDEPHDAPVCDPVLDELRQPFVRNFRMTFAFATPRRFNRRTGEKP